MKYLLYPLGGLFFWVILFHSSLLSQPIAEWSKSIFVVDMFLYVFCVFGCFAIIKATDAGMAKFGGAKK